MYKKNRYKFSIRTYWNAELQVNNRNEGKKALLVKKRSFMVNHIKKVWKN